jgi:hypothetical protein
MHLPEVRPETHNEFSLDWQKNSREILPGLQGYLKNRFIRTRSGFKTSDQVQGSREAGLHVYSK